MHACGICRTACSCGGDVDPVISLVEYPGCLCCIAHCKHGVFAEDPCAACDADSYEPEEDAPSKTHLNGGW